MKPTDVIEYLRSLSHEDRVNFLWDVLEAYCMHCGDSDGTYKCVCMKDE